MFRRISCSNEHLLSAIPSSSERTQFCSQELLRNVRPLYRTRNFPLGSDKFYFVWCVYVCVWCCGFFSSFVIFVCSVCVACLCVAGFFCPT